MKHFSTLLLLAALTLLLPVSLIAQKTSKAEKAEDAAFQLFKTTNLSQQAGLQPMDFDNAPRLPFHDDGKPDGTEIGITNPEGTHYPLSWKGHTWAAFQEVKFTGYCGEMVKSEDGKTVYFHNIMPDFQTYWLKGEIEEDGKEVVISNDQLIFEMNGNKYYFVGMRCELDDYGYATIPKDVDMADCEESVRLPMTPDGGIDGTGFFFWLWGYSHLNHDAQGNPLENDVYMSYSYSMVGSVITEEVVQVLDGLEEEDYYFTELDIYYGYEWADEIGYMGAVKQDGNVVYMRGISSMAPTQYLKANSYGSLLIMPSSQVITDGRFYYIVNAIGNIREEEVTNNGYTYMDWVFDTVSSAYFSVIDDNITLAGGLGICSDFYGSDGFRSYWYVDLKLEKYAGNPAATPTDLEQLNYTEWWEYNFCDFNFFFTCQDVSTGKWINPRRCFYEVYFDDQPYTFTADKHELQEGDTEITQVPVLYKTADFAPYDEFSMWQSEYMSFTMHDSNMKWHEMKMRVGYTDDDNNTTYSNFASVINKNSSLDDEILNEVISTEYYDLQGHRIMRMPTSAGIYLMVKQYSNGSKDVQKVIIK